MSCRWSRLASTRLTASRRGEASRARAPHVLVDESRDAVGLRAPVRGAVEPADPRGDARQAVAARPAHRARERVHGGAAPQLPDAGIRLVEERRRSRAERLQPLEDGRVVAAIEALVEEDVRRRPESPRRTCRAACCRKARIADAHGTHAAVSGQRRDLRLFEHRPAVDAVERLQRAAALRGDDVQQVRQIALHRSRRAELIERIDDEVAVAEPAVAVVPRAAAAGGLGNRRRHGRHDGAGVLAGVELERDGRADHGILPLEGNARDCGPSRASRPMSLRETSARRCSGCRSAFRRDRERS